MQEFEVTYGDKTYKLDRPFFILATQNPIEQSGTFVLPEAQQDRFLLYIKIGYPTDKEETEILKATTGTKKAQLNKVLSGEDIIRLQQLVREVSISDGLIQYVSDVIRSTRPDTTSVDYVEKWVDWGAGPRAGQAMILTAKANALLNGKLAVTLEDLQTVALPVLRHRVLVNFRAEAEDITSDTVTQEILKTVQVKDK
jgi:MoxR-like ATPase